MFSGVGIMAGFSRSQYPRSSKLNENSNLMEYKNLRINDNIEMVLNKKDSAFSVTDPIPIDDDRNIRSFTLNPEFSTKKGCFVIKKLHIICILAIFLIIGIILTVHQKHQQNKESTTTDSIPNVNQIEEKELSADEPTLKPVSKSSNHVMLMTETWNPIKNIDLPDITTLEHLIQPLAYKIYITVPSFGNQFNSPDQSSFHGNVSIVFRSKEEINYILIGASDLRIHKVHLRTFDDNNAEDNRISIDSYDADQGMLVLHTYKSIHSNVKYILSIEYLGDIQKHLPYGLFEISSKIPATGEIRRLIAANTNVPFARTIFPCFDLPTQTSTYELSICRDISMITGTSSSFKASTRDETNTCVWEHFKSTDNTPLHFFGFVISDFAFERKNISKERTFTVWTPYKTFDEISYIMDLGPKLIEVIENYFGVEMPVKNIDIYPVPSIFPYMNSQRGIILIEESKILLRENENSEAQKERIIETLAAHLIEQWTGLINFPNDGDSWLKESIVQYLQYIITNIVEPKWKINENFFANIHQTEMDTDIINSHKKQLNLKYVKHIKKVNKRAPLFPVEVTSVFNSYTDYSKIITTDDEQTEMIPEIYSEIFNRKSLDKGICIFRMIHNIISDSAFRSSLQKLLEMSKVKTVTGDDLWNIMTSEARNMELSGHELLPTGVSLKAIINDWIYNREYPIIKVTRDYEKNSITFVQYIDVGESNKSDRKYFRNIPFSYTTEKEKSFSSTFPIFWMRNVKQTMRRNIPGLTNDTWILVNPKQAYLYRVNYDDENWNMLKKSLKRGEFPADIRAQLLDDALFLARRGFLSYDFAMDFTKSLIVLGEKEYVVWNSVLHHFEYMRSIINIDNNELYEHPRNLFKAFVREAILPMYADMSSFGAFGKKFSNLDQLTELEHNQLLLQSEIYLWACDVGIESCLKKAKLDFTDWKHDPNPRRHLINPNMRYATICNAMRTADENDFEFLHKVYLNTPARDPNKFIYLKGLYCYNKISQVLPKILQITLLNDYSLEHLNEVSNIWQALIERPIASTAPFDYMLMYWKSILKSFSGFIPIMRNIIEGATINIHNDDQLYELQTIKEGIRSSDNPLIYEILNTAIKQVQNRITWMNNGLPPFLEWLKNRKPLEHQMHGGNPEFVERGVHKIDLHHLQKDRHLYSGKAVAMENNFS